MASLNMKRDIKKASYYVWFLGARESRGLRGEEFALPAIQYLERKSRELEPFKVTLQVSHKGLKIVQNVCTKGKQQTIKHFIPHSSITCAVRRGDNVATVLLLFNPVTRCPIHVHVYRCDSERTAEVLTAHLESLIQRPENQKKFADIERKLQIKGAIPQSHAKKASGGSELSDHSNGSSQEERCLANLYDSLAAELKQKLSTGKSPILLPPRDYDTVHRQKGNLSNIDTRRCLNRSIVGVNAPKVKATESSNESSGIGSESPEHSECPRTTNDTHSTSEDEWCDSTAYLLHEAYEMSPPARIRATSPPEPLHRNDRFDNEQKSMRRRLQRDDSIDDDLRYNPKKDDFNKYPERKYNNSSNDKELIIKRKEIAKEDYRHQPRRFEQFRESRLEENNNNRFDKRNRSSRYSPEEDLIDSRQTRKNADLMNYPMQRFGSETSLRTNDVSPKDRFQNAKQKFINMERARFNLELEEHMRARRYMLEKREQEEMKSPPLARRALSPRRPPSPRRNSSPRRTTSPRRRSSPGRMEDMAKKHEYSSRQSRSAALLTEDRKAFERRSALSPKRKDLNKIDEQFQPTPNHRRMEERRDFRKRDDDRYEGEINHFTKFERDFSPQNKIDHNDSGRRLNDLDRGASGRRRFDLMKSDMNLFERRPELPRLTSKSLKRYDQEDNFYRGGNVDDDDDDIEPIVVRRSTQGGATSGNNNWRQTTAGGAAVRHSYAEPAIRHSYAEPTHRMAAAAIARPY